MNREDNLHILKFLSELTQSLVYVAHWFTQILAAVGSNQNYPLIPVVNILKSFVFKYKILPNSFMEGINNSVTSNKNAVLIDGFCQKVALGGISRSKMHIGDGASELAVHFLREW